jgi:WD40 repeat protein
MLNPQSSDKLPDGFVPRHSFDSHHETINDLSWSPDGRRFATCSSDQSVILWNPDLGKRSKLFEGHIRPVRSIAWNYDGILLASGANNLRFYDAHRQQWKKTLPLINGLAYALAWSPTQRSWLACGLNSYASIIEWESGEIIFTLQTRTGAVTGISWSPDGTSLAIASGNETWLLRVDGFQIVRKIAGHAARVNCVAWSRDGLLLASGSDDDTVQVWDTRSWQRLAILEGQTGGIGKLSFSHDSSFLASAARDVRVWRRDSWEPVAVIQASRGEFGLSGLAFSPTSPTLATVAGGGKSVRTWDLDVDRIRKSPPVIPSVHYTNAKVVLLGDTGVGKSGLGLVLAGQPFKATDSTHGRHVWTIESQDVLLPGGGSEAREILLWDMAGQPGYRLIHQLHLNEVAVALVVFDARSETDPFSGIRHWDRALRQAHRRQDGGVTLKKFLVAARIDRGRLGVGQARIQKIIDKHDFSIFIETSARDGTNIFTLREAIAVAIDWGRLPRVTSNDMFQKIKAFIVSEKERGRILTTTDDLYRSYLGQQGHQYAVSAVRSHFATCIGRVESTDLIKRLSFGDLVLLQPEILDAYASAIVNAAKQEPDGLGCIAEDDVKAGRFAISHDERLEDTGQESLLLIATIESMIRSEIALREATGDGVQLVFPSQLTRENPDLPDPEGKASVVMFEGPVVSTYATLCVRLSRSGIFACKEMWKDAMIFHAAAGGTCGISLREVEEGRGELTLFFSPDAGNETVRYFENFIIAHLSRWSIPESIKKRTITACPGCGFEAPEQLLRILRERGRDSYDCPGCSSRVTLKRFEDVIERDTTVMNEMDRTADEHREAETAASILQGKVATSAFDVFLCHNSNDKQSVEQIGIRLKKRGILPWLDKWELRPGEDWMTALEKQIKNIKSAAVFVGKSGFGPWQMAEQSAFIRQFVSRQCPVIPVILPNCAETPELPVFLSGLQWVDFREIDPDPIEQLIYGITGKRH